MSPAASRPEAERAPLLLVDAYLDDVGAARNFLPDLGAETLVWRAAHESLPPAARDARGVVVSGSAASVLDEPPWLATIELLLRAALEADLPLLGVCFGHQVLARAALGPGATRRAAAGELGWVDIERNAEDPLLDALPQRFRCFASHSDEVVPGQALEVLATNAACPVQAFRVPGRRAWGVQFHPEMGTAEAEELVRSRAEQNDLDAEVLLVASRGAHDLGARLLGRFRDLSG